MREEVQGELDGSSRGMSSGQRFRAVSAQVEGRAVAYRLDGTATLIDEAGAELGGPQPRFRWILPLAAGHAPACTVDGVYGLLDAHGHFEPEPQDEEATVRLELTRIAHLLYERDYNASIDGNLSWRLSDDTLLITPSGAVLGFIRPEDFVVTTLEGALLRGGASPTSEYRLHVELHRMRADCRCVIHVHAPYALAASLAGLDLHQTYITVAPVPATAYARISSAGSPEVLRPFMEAYNWAILPRHGIVTWADTPWNAFLRVEGLEHCAKVLVAARACGPIEPMPPGQTRELLTLWGLGHLERSS